MVRLVRQFDWRGALRVALPSGVVSSIVAIGWNACTDRRDRAPLRIRRSNGNGWIREDDVGAVRLPGDRHYAREYVTTTWECAPVPDPCDELAFECAKMSKRALELARLTRRKHRTAPWNRGVADADLEQALDERTPARESRPKLRPEQPTSPDAPLASTCDCGAGLKSGAICCELSIAPRKASYAAASFYQFCFANCSGVSSERDEVPGRTRIRASRARM
ncbi:hypothetical protein [Paraburkholderia phenoliruptrix]|nr:hypothetical protein [Paraburkholderia phenoliruptrix]